MHETGSKEQIVQLGEVHFTEHPHGPYHYLIPPEFQKISAGVRVKVPFGHQQRTGFLVRIFLGELLAEHKPVLTVVDELPIIAVKLLKLTKWMAEYYLCEWGEVLAAAVPSGLKTKSAFKYRLTENARSESWSLQVDTPAAKLWGELSRQPLTLRQVKTRFPGGEELIRKFQHHGWVETVESDPGKPAVRMDTAWIWADEIGFEEALDILPSNARRMREAVHLLSRSKSGLLASKLRKTSPGLGPSLKSLLRKGWLIAKQVPLDAQSRAQFGMDETAEAPPILNDIQLKIARQVLEALKSSKAHTFLLHGVTGAGKTIVYLEAVESALKLGRGAIVLVPEISLTPLLTGRFRRRFGDLVALTHSRMSPAERRDIWQRVKNETVRVVIGPRSALFAPLKDPGLIVIDEEHDESYKQSESNPRYNARDVAIYYAAICNATVLLGSATPDVVSYFNANNNKYHLLSMPERYSGFNLPEVRVVMWGVGKEGSIFCKQLQVRIENRLQRAEQVILLINRRGFSTCITCPDCGETAECPNCDITLRYHREGLRLDCHYCGWTQKPYDLCPKCRSSRLRYTGIGTQQVEKELKRLYPGVRIARMDLDTTRGATAHQTILQSFANREFDILLGTKMVAKGHDFPGVTLVGVLTADIEWLWPDFRSHERAFRLLVQASGRAGRSNVGEVVIQSWNPTIELLRWIQAHDYKSLYDSEIKSRQRLQYPPFSRLVSIMIRGEVQEQVIEIAQDIKQQFDRNLEVSAVLGPAPPAIERVARQFRRRILIKLPEKYGKTVKLEKMLVKRVTDEFRKSSRKDQIVISIDVDPIEV